MPNVDKKKYISKIIILGIAQMADRVAFFFRKNLPKKSRFSQNVGDAKGLFNQKKKKNVFLTIFVIDSSSHLKMLKTNLIRIYNIEVSKSSLRDLIIIS